MNPAFAGPTAFHYRRYRRDVPDALLDRLLEHVELTDDAVALDLGAGTGQVAIPLARRLGAVLAVEPEADMLTQLRQRGEEENVRNLLCVLASDRDVPTVLGTVGRGKCGLLTVANALHWMDAPALFAAAEQGLAPGGAVAIITHGIPLWLTEADWARALNAYLADWFGRPVTASCGSDEAALREREDQLAAAGFADVSVLEHRYQAEVSVDYVIGHLYSALDGDVLPSARRPEFEDGLRRALRPFWGVQMREDVPVTALVGRREPHVDENEADDEPVSQANHGDDAGDYDALPADEQAAVRARWSEEIPRRAAALDFTAEFTAAGRAYSELDENGNVVHRQPGG